MHSRRPIPAPSKGSDRQLRVRGRRRHMTLGNLPDGANRGRERESERLNGQRAMAPCRCVGRRGHAGACSTGRARLPRVRPSTYSSSVAGKCCHVCVLFVCVRSAAREMVCHWLVSCLQNPTGASGSVRALNLNTRRARWLPPSARCAAIFPLFDVFVWILECHDWKVNWSSRQAQGTALREGVRSIDGVI